MPTGYKVLFPWEAPTTLASQDFNRVLEAMVEAICDEFLPQKGWRLDPDPNREEKEWWKTRPEAERHYFLTPGLVQSWIKDGGTEVEGAVFILGPFFGSPSESGKKGVVVFCYCEMDHQIREFWHDLAKFLQQKTPQIVKELKLATTT